MSSKSKRRHKRESNKETNVVDLNTYKNKKITLIPRSLTQEEYIEHLLNPTRAIVFGIGPAGTGKTMLAVMTAIKALKEGTTDRIIVTRPAVGVDGEKHGFLPGDLNQKMEPWTRPIFDVFNEYYTSKDIITMMEENIIEISPLAFMRGRNFHNSFIIADEIQNTTENQMKMLLTRIGENSKMVLTGDLEQTDIMKENGLTQFIDVMSRNKSNLVSYVQFTNRDIQRSDAVKEILRMYKEY